MLRFIIFSFALGTQSVEVDLIMSQHEAASNPIDYPALLHELVQRIAALESQPSSGSPNHPSHIDHDAMESDDDLHVTEQAPTTVLTPYPAFVEAMPSMANDFFQTILDDDTRRSFLHQCPRNTARQYQPPPLNDIELSERAKQVDRQLRAVQYRLSGITRPIDLFVHDILRTNAVSVHTALRFVNTIHSLLADAVSVVTQTRTDSVCRAAGLASAPVCDPSQPANRPLLDTACVLEQTQLAQTLGKLSRHPRNVRRPASSSRAAETRPPSDVQTFQQTRTADRRPHYNNYNRGQSGFQSRGRNTSRRRPTQNETDQ